MNAYRLKLNVELFKKVYLLRRSEEKIVKNYDDNEMKTPMHMSMGEEAIAAGVSYSLDNKDLIFGTYRSHGIYLARTGNTDGFFAELYGKETGVIRGKGGSMHLSAPDKGLLATSAVVASTIPVAVGAAYSLKTRQIKGVSVVFMGDGAIDEGVFWESLNMACLFKLPVIFVCEDNGFAVHTPGNSRHGYKSIENIVSKFDCGVFSVNSTDAEVIYNLAKKAKVFVKSKKRPAFLYLKYYRYLEHVGTHEDFEAGYRDKKDFEKWLRKDPLKVLLRKLKVLGISQMKTENVCKQIDIKINKSFKDAKAAKYPKSTELLRNVFYEN